MTLLIDGDTETRPPLPPFTLDTAIQKVRAAEDGWNSCDPERGWPAPAVSRVAGAMGRNSSPRFFGANGTASWTID